MGMVIDGIGTSEAVDSSGEVLELKGLDISDLVEGRAVLNTEHRGDDAPGYSYLDIIGRVIYAKKIYERGDCENNRQRDYWDQVKLPFLYIKCELFDDPEDGDHAAARAAAAMIRHYNRRGLPILIRFSIEGSTLTMEDKVIKAAIARRVAATIKPANKTCNSGILEDERDKGRKSKREGSFEGGTGGVVDEESVFSKFERPDAKRLGYSHTLTWDPEVDEVTENFVERARHFLELAKALEGGQMNAAPSTLTGGAALQREDLGEDSRRRQIIAVCKGALRDHDPIVHGPFRQYLKSLLPEACDEFLDRFEELADEVDIKAKIGALRKAQAAAKTSTPKPKRASQAAASREQLEANYRETIDRIKEARAAAFPPGTEDEEGRLPPIETAAFKCVKPRDLKRGDNVVDEKTGVVYVGGTEANPPRAHKLYAPSVDDAHYMEHLTDPQINAIHDKAMGNWVLMHRLARTGKLPSEVITHAALFSLMSPNTAVPIQELAYGHLMDMKAKGFDPTKKYTGKEMKQYEKEFKALMSGQAAPEYMRNHFLSEQARIWRKPYNFELEQGGIWDPKTMQRNPDPEQKIRHSVGMPEKKWEGVENYHDLHSFLEGLVREHGADAAAISAKLNALKHEKQKFDTRRRTAEKQGRPEPEDPNADKPKVRMFAPKTIRYMLGMLGGGNVVVPDTHFIRHTFGMHPDDPRINDVKVLLKAQHEPLWQGVDRWYRANHPAFEWTRQKLQRQYGEDFGDQATFPSFWMHWLTIAPHERAAKWPTGTIANEGTDHAVFWNSVYNILDRYNLPHDPHDPSLRKSEAWADGGSLPARTAHAMKEVQDRFGKTAATFAYYTYLAPLLMAPSKPAELYKAELMARLMKGEFSEEDSAPKHYMHKGSLVEPGEIQWVAGAQAGKSRPLIAIGKDYHHVLDEGVLKRVKANHTNVRITKEPRIARANTMVDSKKHGHPTLHGTDAQHDLIHGLNFAKKIGEPKHGASWRRFGGGDSGWYQSDEGNHAFVKRTVGMDNFAGLGEGFFDKNFSTAHRETAFYRLADEVFGLGAHVPVTTTFKHPISGAWYSAQQRVEGEHYSPTSMSNKEALGQLARKGTLDKLALMDMVLGQFDRHSQNAIISPDGQMLYLIDNGLAMPPEMPGKLDSFVPEAPEPWKAGHRYNDGKDWYTKPLHSDAVRWVESLDPQKLAKHMDQLGVPKGSRDEAVRRLMSLQKRVARGNVSRSAAYHAPFLEPSATIYSTPAKRQAMMEERSALREPVR